MHRFPTFHHLHCLLLLLALTTTTTHTTATTALPQESQQWIDDSEFAATNLQALDSRIIIDDEEYKAECKCHVPPPRHAIQCYPSQITITKQDDLPGTLLPGRLVLDGSNLRLLIGDPATLKMVDVTKSAYHDIDGRSSEESIRIWGGEAGELLLALAVWDDLTKQSTGSPLRYTSVQKAIHSWIKYQNANNKRQYFYLSTDVDAMAYVESQLASTTDNEYEQSNNHVDITMPDETRQDDILKALLTVNGTGCPYFKFILKNPTKYKIRPQLIEEFFTAIYRLMWNMNEPLRKKIKVYIYHSKNMGRSSHAGADEGEGGEGQKDAAAAAPYAGLGNIQHREQEAISVPREAAWVDIVSDDVCFKEKKVAAFPAFSEDVSVFVNYPQAIDALHKEAAQFVKGMTGGAVPTTEIFPKLKLKYDSWDALTKQHFINTQGLVRYEVKVGTNGGGVADEKEEGKSGGSGGAGVVPPNDPALMFKVGPLPFEE